MIGRFPLTILIGIVAVIWALVLSSHGWAIPSSFFGPLSIAVSVISAILVVFESWAWAWPGIRALSKRPDLRGTWTGTIRSNWEGGTETAKGSPIKAYLAIHQTFTTLHLRVLTAESQSLTLAASLICEPDGVFAIHAVYRNEPKLSVRSRSPMHHGGLVLRLEGPPPEAMSGHYWTDRHSDGELEFRLVSRKRADDYRTAQAIASKPRADASGTQKK